MDYQLAMVLIPRLRCHMSHKNATIVCTANKDMHRLWKEQCHGRVTRMKNNCALEGIDIPIQYNNVNCPVCRRRGGLLLMRKQRNSRIGCTLCGYMWMDGYL